MFLIFFFFIRSEIQVSTVNGGKVASGRRQRRRPGTQGTSECSEYRLFSSPSPLSSPAPLLALPSSSLSLTRRRQLAIILLPGVWGHQWTPRRNPAQPQPLDCTFLGGIPWGPGLPPWFNRMTLSSLGRVNSLLPVLWRLHTLQRQPPTLQQVDINFPHFLLLTQNFFQQKLHSEGL